MSDPQLPAADPHSLWGRLRQGLATRLSEASFQEWIAPCTPLRMEGTTLWVRVPSPSTKLWIEQQLVEEFNDTLSQEGLQELRLAFLVDGATPAVSAPRAMAPTEAETSVPNSPLPVLFQRYTLDRFVVGPNSQLAFAAARAVVDSHGRSSGTLAMNPFFIYGGTGLGKTHLMIGIGHALREQDPGLRLTYLKVDQFFHEVTAAIARRNTEPLRRKYQQNDVLLLDDVQTLGKLERTQEEIFYVLEYLLQHGKQIIITSDKPPQKLEGVHDRLITRFKWGLTADIQPPDFETRFAILKRKLEDPDFRDFPDVPDDVLTFIAHKGKGSVRDLEGLVTRVVYQASFMGVPVSLDLAHAAFQGSSGEEPGAAIPPERIYRLTAETFGISLMDLMKKKSRKPDALLPRQVAMYLARELAQVSLAEIGKAFSMHHSTVMNSVDKVKDRMQKDSDFHKTVHALLNSIQ
ncbi:MAG TPA: chromosomal replication initiator protein DnaA [Holophagaceae bacterium]|nr:chromosomal replication initiator protein DnaA [Holophagaceae bacterium]